MDSATPRLVDLGETGIHKLRRADPGKMLRRDVKVCEDKNLRSVREGQEGNKTVCEEWGVASKDRLGAIPPEFG